MFAPPKSERILTLFRGFFAARKVALEISAGGVVFFAGGFRIKARGKHDLTSDWMRGVGIEKDKDDENSKDILRRVHASTLVAGLGLTVGYLEGNALGCAKRVVLRTLGKDERQQPRSERANQVMGDDVRFDPASSGCQPIRRYSSRFPHTAHQLLTCETFTDMSGQRACD